MEISSIINKDNLHSEEMKYVIEKYIKEKKGKEVKLMLKLDRGVFDFHEWGLFNTAYDYAMAYFKEKEHNGKN